MPRSSKTRSALTAAKRVQENDLFWGRSTNQWCACSLWRLRVAAAFLADADLLADEREADALPPISPPLCAAGWPVCWLRPEPPSLLPPPSSLLTVAQARRSASFSDTPRCS